MKAARNLLEQSLKRLNVRLLELNAWCDRDRQFIDQGEFCAAPGAARSILRSGESWPALGEPVEIRFAASVPQHWAGFPVHGRFRLGGEALPARHAGW